ncbi:MAG: hypothetical protein JXQ27_17815 [Acidobacteria bacterium]|nr:hypothetical protein [Acidobacteriota bacterium]
MELALLQITIEDRREDTAAVLERFFAQDYAGEILIGLPELFHTNYSALPDSAISQADDLLERIRRLSEAHPSTLICGTAALRSEHRIVNELLIFYKGEMIPLYRKLHLFRPMGEHRLITPGTNLAVVDLPAGNTRWRIGFAICYDLRFPEIFRLLRAEGCQLVVVPAQWPARRVDTWSLLLRARAAENQYFTAGINRVGRDGVEQFGGRSALVDPLGRILTDATDAPAVIRGRLDPGAVTSAREFNDSLSHRRADLYRLQWTGTWCRVDLTTR